MRAFNHLLTAFDGLIIAAVVLKPGQGQGLRQTFRLLVLLVLSQTPHQPHRLRFRHSHRQMGHLVPISLVTAYFNPLLVLPYVFLYPYFILHRCSKEHKGNHNNSDNQDRPTLRRCRWVYRRRRGYRWSYPQRRQRTHKSWRTDQGSYIHCIRQSRELEFRACRC